MSLPQIASRDEWLAARTALLAKEKELTRQRDALNAERRMLPMVEIDKAYVFEGPDGLLDDAGGDFNVLHVHQEGGDADVVNLLGGQPHLLGDLLRQGGHALGAAFQGGIGALGGNNIGAVLTDSGYKWCYNINRQGNHGYNGGGLAASGRSAAH